MSEFPEQLREALSKLADPVGLPNASLVRALRARQSGANQRRVADEVRRGPIEAIESLRPKSSSGQIPCTGRGYEILRRRYVEGEDPVNVQRQLGLSKTLYYVEHNRAVDALVALLTDRWATDPSQAARTEEVANRSLSSLQPLTSFVELPHFGARVMTTRRRVPSRRCVRTRLG